MTTDGPSQSRVSPGPDDGRATLGGLPRPRCSTIGKTAFADEPMGFDIGRARRCSGSLAPLSLLRRGSGEFHGSDTAGSSCLSAVCSRWRQQCRRLASAGGVKTMVAHATGQEIRGWLELSWRHPIVATMLPHLYLKIYPYARCVGVSSAERGLICVFLCQILSKFAHLPIPKARRRS